MSNSKNYAWMIERRAIIGNSSSLPLWWDGRDFTPDPNGGIRFSRKEDAETVITTHGLMHAVATDHEWV